MAERTLSQMYFEDGISLREIARKVGILDHQGAVFHLRNPKTGEKEKLSIGMSEGVEKTKAKKNLKVKLLPNKNQKTFKQRYDKIKALTKPQQTKLLKGFGLSWTERRKLKYEDQRINKIIELQDKNIK